MQEFKQKTEELKDGDTFDPRLLFNFDETKVGGEEDHRKAAHIKGTAKPSRTVKKPGEHITLILFCNANGDRLKPLLIFALKTDPPLSDINKAHFNRAGSLTGFINQQICKNWFENVMVSEIDNYRNSIGKPGAAVLVLYDNDNSRDKIDFEALKNDHNIHLMAFPAHSSALLQPLDLSPHGQLKKMFRGYNELEDLPDPKDRRDRRLEFLWDCIGVAAAPYYIKTGFRRTGLHPFDPDVPLGMDMFTFPHTPLPEELKRKRGPKFDGDGVFIEGGAVVHSSKDLNKENENFQNSNESKGQPNKKKKSFNS